MLRCKTHRFCPIFTIPVKVRTSNFVIFTLRCKSRTKAWRLTLGFLRSPKIVANVWTFYCNFFIGDLFLFASKLSPSKGDAKILHKYWHWKYWVRVKQDWWTCCSWTLNVLDAYIESVRPIHKTKKNRKSAYYLFSSSPGVTFIDDC